MITVTEDNTTWYKLTANFDKVTPLQNQPGSIYIVVNVYLWHFKNAGVRRELSIARHYICHCKFRMKISKLLKGSGH